MKLYNSMGPNPKIVRMFLAEKGIELPLVPVDLMRGENRQRPYLDKNPAGQMPALELDDGTILTEVVAICEYLDETGPGPSLIGSTPLERAETRMWTRRIDLNIAEPMLNGFRYAEGLPLFKDRLHCIPQASEDLKLSARKKLAWLDELMDGRPYIAGDRLTLADIFLFAMLEFGATVGQTLAPELAHVPAWYERMKARPSARA
ncbi:MAG TPA: glutathione S-transferase family protein [Aliidongia sp.]|nr:glutathione S-transferase family protein [Aliidongia sp.]